MWEPLFQKNPHQAKFIPYRYIPEAWTNILGATSLLNEQFLFGVEYQKIHRSVVQSCGVYNISNSVGYILLQEKYFHWISCNFYCSKVTETQNQLSGNFRHRYQISPSPLPFPHRGMREWRKVTKQQARSQKKQLAPLRITCGFDKSIHYFCFAMLKKTLLVCTILFWIAAIAADVEPQEPHYKDGLHNQK